MVQDNTADNTASSKESRIEAAVNNLIEVDKKSQTYLLPATASDWAKTKNKDLEDYTLIGIEALVHARHLTRSISAYLPGSLGSLRIEVLQKIGEYIEDKEHSLILSDEFEKNFPLSIMPTHPDQIYLSYITPQTQIILLHGKARLIAKAEKIGAEVVTDFRINPIKSWVPDNPESVIYFSGTAVVKKKSGIESVLKE